jgi:hypothetical protein
MYVLLLTNIVIYNCTFILLIFRLFNRAAIISDYRPSIENQIFAFYLPIVGWKLITIDLCAIRHCCNLTVTQNALRDKFTKL